MVAPRERTFPSAGTDRHSGQTEADRLVQLCLQNVRRIEQQFSLYRTESAICTLNRTGVLVAPDADMVSLL